MDVACPALADGFDLEVWYRPDVNSPLGSGPLHTDSFLPGTMVLNIAVPSDPAPVLQFVFRPTDLSVQTGPFPALVLVWSPDALLNVALATEANSSYAWQDGTAGGGDGGGGTTRTPVLGPPTGGG